MFIKMKNALSTNRGGLALLTFIPMDCLKISPYLPQSHVGYVIFYFLVIKFRWYSVQNLAKKFFCFFIKLDKFTKIINK